MDREALKARTKAFAVRVAKMAAALPRTRVADIVAQQLVRSATSVGANYRAACRARSHREFTAKIGIVAEEADESLYWLEILVETGLLPQVRLKDLSLMIVFSATLPTFLGTMTALEQKNYDITARFNTGAPVTVQLSRWGSYYFDSNAQENLPPSAVDKVRTTPGVTQAAGLTAEYRADVANRIELRNTPVQIRGLTGSLDGIVYADLLKYTAGGPSMFDQVMAEPDTIILSAGYAEFMDLDLGDAVRVKGAGLDHTVVMRVVGLIERMPGFAGFSRNENYVRWGESVGFVSLETYLRLTDDPNDWLTTLAILVMVIAASVISAGLAARGVVRSKVTRILREAF
jgi:four helix bundle protein